MNNVKEFLETSTIHGLAFLSTTRKYSRFFWLSIVSFGFSGAFYLIFQAFNNWEQSPISTTIETLPISEITFPNVTVCPPKNSVLREDFMLKLLSIFHLFQGFNFKLSKL